jgi:hypothetical protein
MCRGNPEIDPFENDKFTSNITVNFVTTSTECSSLALVPMMFTTQTFSSNSNDRYETWDGVVGPVLLLLPVVGERRRPIVVPERLHYHHAQS